MKYPYFAFIAALFFVATSVKADNSPAKKDCGNLEGTMLEINYCAAKQYKLADDELNRLFKEKMAALETKESKDRLRDAQRAWVLFRDKACSYEADQFSGGSIWPLMQNNCMERQTQKRITDLKDYLACTANDCPN